MFTHRVLISLKPDSFIELSRKIETEIMPALRLQKGFCGGTTVVMPERSSATGETRWETREDAEAYQRNGFADVLKMLSSVAETTPTASIFELHK